MNLLRAALPLVVTATLLCLTPSANSGIDVKFGAAVQLNDRTDLYVSISSRYFDRDRDTVRTWGARYRNPDDLAVALFISRHSGRSLAEIWAMRHQRGLTWWEISVRYRMPIDVWFVEVERDPGPPYGKAYGYWRKHRHNRRTRIVLADSDVRNLVAVRMIHEYYRVPIDTAMEWRAGGTNLRDLMSDRYERRHGKPYRVSKVTKAAKTHPGNGKSRGKSKNR
jgi:hypothetical protein